MTSIYLIFGINSSWCLTLPALDFLKAFNGISHKKSHAIKFLPNYSDLIFPQIMAFVSCFRGARKGWVTITANVMEA